MSNKHGEKRREGSDWRVICWISRLFWNRAGLAVVERKSSIFPSLPQPDTMRKIDATNAKYLLDYLYYTRDDEQFRFYKKVSLV